jgi:uncharacterized protein YndB with AHSA1/START domain
VISSSIDIDRPPEDVFAYVAELDRHCEWQPAIVAGHKSPEGPTAMGTLNYETRKIPGGPREFVSEVVEFDAPRRIVAVGQNGPVRPRVTVEVAPLDGGSRSRFTMSLEINGHGIGVLFAMLARRSARKTVPEDQARLKAILESPSGPGPKPG